MELSREFAHGAAFLFTSAALTSLNSIIFQPDHLRARAFFSPLPSPFCFAGSCRILVFSVMSASFAAQGQRDNWKYFQFRVCKFVLAECLTSGAYLREDVLSRARWCRSVYHYRSPGTVVLVIIRCEGWRKENETQMKEGG